MVAKSWLASLCCSRRGESAATQELRSKNGNFDMLMTTFGKGEIPRIPSKLFIAHIILMLRQLMQACDDAENVIADVERTS